MDVIRSDSNQYYKQCIRLERKKYRDKEGLYIVEGENLVKEAVLQNFHIRALILRSDLTDIQEWKSFGEDNDNIDRVIVFLEELFNRICDTGTSQGMLAIVEKPSRPFSELENQDLDLNWLVLDRLQDPGNTGTMIRTAEGAGYGAVLTIKGTCDVYSPKVTRAAAGALFRMPIYGFDGIEDLVTFVKNNQRRLAVTCLDGAVSYTEADIGRRTALVIGNEGNGCDREIMEAADVRVTIPMKGRLESLNAAVSAGILMYEAMR